MPRVAVPLCLALIALTSALWSAPEIPWLNFDAAAQPPVRFETKVPASAALVDGPPGHRAVSVTVPDISRDEKACAFGIALPKLAGQHNSVRLWLKGSTKTTRLEIAFRSDVGSFGGDFPLEPTWQELVISANNTHPILGTTAGRLDLSRATEVRFCFGEWQGLSGGPQNVSIGPLDALETPILATPGPVKEIAKPNVPMPLQPFTVDLLDRKRGEWRFPDALGQRIDLDGPVNGYAFYGNEKGRGVLQYLGCDPEFPDDLTHATLKVPTPVHQEGGSIWYRIEEPHFAATVEASPLGDTWRCRLTDISLGPAVTGDTYVAAMYLDSHPVWLAPDSEGLRLNPRLLTDRVGNVFSEGEPVRLTLAASALNATPRPVALEVRDYNTGQSVWHGTATLTPGSPAQAVCPIPLTRFGIFEVIATVPGAPPAKLRSCRVPRPNATKPDDSAIGINLFQQQIWWYAYQPALIAKAGVHWIRPWLAWENTWGTQQPAPDKWDTRALDASLRRMDKYGLRYQDILFAAPQWVTGNAGWTAPPLAKMDLWGAYVEKLVRQYKGRISHWEIWNEPDLMWPEDTRHSGEHYMALLKTGYAAAKRADPNCTVLGLSHAGYEEWAAKVGDLGAKDYMDIATIHVYGDPSQFLKNSQRRKALLARHGLGDKPLWLNEIGATAYDFSPEYSAEFHCSERSQAQTVVTTYATALSLDPHMKAFWFCTYDPRDPAHKSQWTGDAGIGVLYLGFLPKLSYAALAALAHELDGHKCLGRADITPELHQVSFAGPVTAIWHDRPEQSRPVAATEIGCGPDEQIAVRDMFGNAVVSGKASGIRVDFSRGALYVAGSRQLAAIAQAEVAADPDTRETMLERGKSVTVRLPAAAGVTTLVKTQPTVPVSAKMAPVAPGAKREVVLSVAPDVQRVSGQVAIVSHFPKGTFGLAGDRDVTRAVAVTLGEPNLIRDGGFFVGDLSEWAPQRDSLYAYDAQVGHNAPGSLRLDGPFDRRLVHWNTKPVVGRPIRLSCWVKSERLSVATVTLSLAFFGPDKWLVTPCLATSGAAGEIEGGWKTIDGYAKIPLGTNDWTLVTATLPADQVPAGLANAAFVLDVKGGGEGRLWLDDIDLWQPEAK